jgi:hypothetical protein
VFRIEPLNKNFILDVLFEVVLMPEIKALEKILPVHEALLLTYLKLSNKKLS